MEGVNGQMTFSLDQHKRHFTNHNNHFRQFNICFQHFINCFFESRLLCFTFDP